MVRVRFSQSSAGDKFLVFVQFVLVFTSKRLRAAYRYDIGHHTKHLFEVRVLVRLRFKT